MSAQLEEELSRLDAALAAAERQAKAVLSGLRALRRQATSGVVAGLSRRLEQLPATAELLTSALAVATSFSYDAEAALADGRYLKELLAAAEAKGLVLVERDGRITAFPPLLKLEPAVPAVRVGRKLERQIRPGVLTALLKKAQSSVFNAEAFLETLFKAATHLARTEHRGDEPGALLTPPSEADLRRHAERLRVSYGMGYDWEAPPATIGERRANRTMRHHIRGWITQWDVLRLQGRAARLEHGTVAMNYVETEDLDEPPPDG